MIAPYQQHPLIIQGGMGVGVSNWRLAHAVAKSGQLGVVSGTMLDTVMIRRLQDGDTDGAIRRALAQFPDEAIAQEILQRYYIDGGRKPEQPYKLLPLPTHINHPLRDKIGVAAGFVEIFLAKEGHQGRVGMNLLTKIVHSHLAILYGGMLAGLDYLLMGAGIPKEIPALLDKLAPHQAIEIKVDVEEGEGIWLNFDPAQITLPERNPLTRPYFLPIVSSHSLAVMLSRKASGTVDGFIVESPIAGGHNAPPRGGIVLDDHGEPIYGARDEVDLGVMCSLGLPFWLAGGMASAHSLAEAVQVGATGIQVGTLFALTQESGFTDTIKTNIIKAILEDTLEVFTDPYASPTGFPFKVLNCADSLSENTVYEARERYCDLGYLRNAYRQDDDTVGFRCAAEPRDLFVKKGGLVEKTLNCKCLCNSLLAAVGLTQIRSGGELEPPLVTGSQEASQLKRFLANLPDGNFSATKAVEYLLSR